MDLVLDIVFDAASDTLALVPFLFVTFALLALFEFAAGDKIRQSIQRAGAAGPLVGSIAGIVPQCGFSAMGATLYASDVISAGTLVAVFLSTSDEMLPLLVAEQTSMGDMARILLVKAIVALVTGLFIDLALKAYRGSARLQALFDRHADEASSEPDPIWEAVSQVCLLRRLGPSGYPLGEFVISDYTQPPSYQMACTCGCEEVDPTDKRAVAGFVLRSALRHTLQVCVFIFVVTLVLVGVLELVGQDALSQILAANKVLAVFVSGLVALIPNCAASVVITQLYLEGVLSFGPMMAGSLIGVGVGFLVLFQTNENPRENALILAVLYAAGVFWGLVFTGLSPSFLWL